MPYAVIIARTVEKEMDRLPSHVHDRLARRILSLEDNPRPRGAGKLSNEEAYRVRVGDYRILYVVDDEEFVVTVLSVGHRRDVYR